MLTEWAERVALNRDIYHEMTCLAVSNPNTSSQRIIISIFPQNKLAKGVLIPYSCHGHGGFNKTQLRPHHVWIYQIRSC